MSTGKKRTFSRSTGAAVVAGGLAIAAAGVMAVSASGTAETSQGDVSRAAEQAVNSLLAGGSPVAAETAGEIESSSVLRQYGADVARARAIKPPPGAPSDSVWTAIPAGNAGVCLAVDNALFCGGAEHVVGAGVSGMKITQGDTKISEKEPGRSILAAGGTAEISGVVRAGVDSVVALDAEGNVSAVARVSGQAYRLTVPTEGLNKIELRDEREAVLQVQEIK